MHVPDNLVLGVRSVHQVKSVAERVLVLIVIGWETLTKLMAWNQNSSTQCLRRWAVYLDFNLRSMSGQLSISYRCYANIKRQSKRRSSNEQGSKGFTCNDGSSGSKEQRKEGCCNLQRTRWSTLQSAVQICVYFSTPPQEFPNWFCSKIPLTLVGYYTSLKGDLGKCHRFNFAVGRGNFHHRCIRMG